MRCISDFAQNDHSLRNNGANSTQKYRSGALDTQGLKKKRAVRQVIKGRVNLRASEVGESLKDSQLH